MTTKNLMSLSGGEAFIEPAEASVLELTQFDEQLRAFNWDYALSDNPAEWETGLTMQENMFAQATRLGMEAMQMYFEALGYPKPN